MPISIAEHTRFANPCTRMVVEHEDRYLLVQEGKPHVRGLWAFPGGKLDVGELLVPSVLREVLEETGVVAEVTGFLGLQHSLWEGKPGYTTEFEFIGRARSLPTDFQIPAEVLAVEWLTLGEIRQLDTNGLLRSEVQRGILRMLESGAVLPLSAIQEYQSLSRPPEADA